MDESGEPQLKQTLEGRLSAALLCLVCLIIFLQILGRFGFFPGQAWTEELTRWAWVWMAFFGLAAAEKHGQHLRMEVFTAALSARAQSGMQRVQDALALVLALYLCWQGYKGVLRTWSNESVTLPVSDAVLYAALPVGAAWWAFRLAQRLFRPAATSI